MEPKNIFELINMNVVDMSKDLVVIQMNYLVYLLWEWDI